MPYKFNPISGQMDYYQASTGATDVTSTAVIADDVAVRGDGGVRGVQGSAIIIDDTGSMVIPGSLTIGESEKDVNFTINGASITAGAALHSSGVSDLAGFVEERHSTIAAFGAHNLMLRSRGTEAGAAVVQNGDILGRVISCGYDGTDFAQSAEIRTSVDGTPGNDDMPGKITMHTSADGSQAPTLGFTLDSTQTVTLANALGLASGGTGATSFTAGSVIFSDGSTLVEDNANFFWDDTNNRLGIGTTTPRDTLTVVGDACIQHTASEDDDHGLEIICDAAGFGDVKALDIDYITGAMAAGDDEEAILVNIDESLSTGGEISGYQVLSTAEGSATIHGYVTGINVNPVLHNTGAFGDADSILNKAVDVTAALASGGAGNISVFVADNDTVTYGDAAKWNEMEFILDTPASGAGIAPTFEFSTGGAGFTAFSPSDGTNGLRNTGAVLWIAADLVGWATNASGDFEIRHTRTRNSLSTTPILDEVQIVSATEYSWDAAGDVNVKSIVLSTALVETSGGTGQSTFTAGDILYSDSANSLAKLAKGSDTEILTLASGIPSWAAPAGGGGIMVQQVYGVSVTAGSTTSNILLDNSIPQITEGAEVITVTITPTSDSNILVIEANGPFTNSTTNPVVIALFQDSTAGAIGATSMQFESSDTSSIYIQHRMVSGTAIATTFKLRYGRGSNTGTVYVNGDTGGRVLGGVAETWIKVTELTV